MMGKARESDAVDESPMFLHKLADSSEPVKLNNWTAQQFAQSYVRYKPHLVRQATAVLGDAGLAEDVVQDAFLYLMTSLPELDSELGVFRYLRWKTKMLSLDLVKSRGFAATQSIDSLEGFPQLKSNAPEVSDSIERADDLAIVSMALSKLQPRQREALIVSLYEERSLSEAASMMQLNENAFRQLLFRARSSFKKSLEGEASKAGTTVSEILSSAGRRARKQAFTIASSLAILTAFALSPAPGNLFEASTKSDPGYEAFSATEEQREFQELSSQLESERNREPYQVTNPQGSDEGFKIFHGDLDAAPSGDPGSLGSEIGDVPSNFQDATEESKSSLASILDSGYASMLSATTTGIVSQVGNGQISLFSANNLAADIAYDLSTESIVQHVVFTFDVEGGVIVGVPQSSLARSEMKDGVLSVFYAATDLVVGDFLGSYGYESVSGGAFSKSAFMVDLEFSQDGLLLASDIRVEPRQ